MGSSGDKTVKFTIVKGNIEKTPTSKVTLFCYKGETKASESITVTIKRDPNANPDADDKKFTFQTSNKKTEETIKWEKDKKATINLELAVSQEKYSSCSTEKVNDTN
ncbi:MAG: hypothetical protein WC422_03160 [Candidatus Paceibacterota bacterium]